MKNLRNDLVRVGILGNLSSEKKGNIRNSLLVKNLIISYKPILSVVAMMIGILSTISTYVMNQDNQSRLLVRCLIRAYIYITYRINMKE